MKGAILTRYPVPYRIPNRDPVPIGWVNPLRDPSATPQEFPDPSFTTDAPPNLAHPTLRSLRRARARQARRTEAGGVWVNLVEFEAKTSGNWTWKLMKPYKKWVKIKSFFSKDSNFNLSHPSWCFLHVCFFLPRSSVAPSRIFSSLLVWWPFCANMIQLIKGTYKGTSDGRPEQLVICGEDLLTWTRWPGKTEQCLDSV